MRRSHGRTAIPINRLSLTLRWRPFTSAGCSTQAMWRPSSALSPAISQSKLPLPPTTKFCCSGARNQTFAKILVRIFSAFRFYLGGSNAPNLGGLPVEGAWNMGRKRRSILLLTSALVGLAFFWSGAAASAADQIYQFDIPAESLSSGADGFLASFLATDHILGKRRQGTQVERVTWPLYADPSAKRTTDRHGSQS